MVQAVTGSAEEAEQLASGGLQQRAAVAAGHELGPGEVTSGFLHRAEAPHCEAVTAPRPHQGGVLSLPRGPHVVVTLSSHPTGELLDGQRGLVPSNFVDFVQDSESRLGTLGTGQDQNLINLSGIGPEAENILDLHSPTPPDSGVTDNGTGTLAVDIDDVGEDTVPYPRKITLIKQLARSVIVGWEPPALPPGWGAGSSYSVLVGQEPRLSLPLAGRTKALVEKLDMAAGTYRVSVQCVTGRGSSDPLRCTLLVGKDVAVAPSQLRVDSVTQTSAQLSWLPTNSNYSHVVFLNEEELGVVRAARYKFPLSNLRPSVAYKVKVLARPHQMPWQLPLEQREKKEAFVEFSTLPAGEPVLPRGPPGARTPEVTGTTWGWVGRREGAEGSCVRPTYPSVALENPLNRQPRARAMGSVRMCACV